MVFSLKQIFVTVYYDILYKMEIFYLKSCIYIYYFFSFNSYGITENSGISLLEATGTSY